MVGAPDFAWKTIAASDFTMPPPPAPGSPESVSDLTTLLRLQTARTEQDCTFARTQDIPDFHSLYDGSGLLSKPELAAVGPLMAEISQFTDQVNGFFKIKHPRSRPYSEDQRIQPCVDKPGKSSYPSAHAACAAVDACVLGRIFPDRAKSLAAYGKYLGDLRAIVGVHHPSDITAGQNLADQICSRLLQEDDFRAELLRVESSLPTR